jgi:hypothetical protein
MESTDFRVEQLKVQTGIRNRCLENEIDISALSWFTKVFIENKEKKRIYIYISVLQK